MHSILSVLAYFAILTTAGAVKTTTKVCPLLGPSFPVPTTLSSNKRFQEATRNFEAAVNTSLVTGMSPNNGPNAFNQTSFSIGIFSTAEKDLLYEFHYTDPSVRNSSSGTKSVNSDSVYRLGSIGKILSVYIFLIRDGDVHWNEPITKYIPELAAVPANGTALPNGKAPKWNEITIGQLTSHMSGLPRDFGVSDSSYPWLNHSGFPPIPENEIPNCNYFLPNFTYIHCNREQYLAGAMAEPAIFQSASTPVYSNNAFVLLAIALENITGQSLGTIFNESLIEALDLPGTSFDVPSSDQNGVIPGGPSASGWDSEMEAFAAAGAYFSSTKDMATIGKAIMNSTLLSKAQTRRWLKPVTFTSDVHAGVGSPWEIFRTDIGGRTVDLYAKNGGWGAYSTELVLAPDYEFGFVVLTASTLNFYTDTGLVYFLSEMVGSEVLPVLEEAARDQAKAAFVGNYAAKDSNSSLVITVDDQPGLRVTQWISNGTEILNAILPPGPPGTYVDFRLQPNELYDGDQVGFTGTFQRLPKRIYSGPLNVNCLSWPTVDTYIYGNVGIEEFVFEIDLTTGKATGVSPKALRVKLERQE